MFSHNLRYQIGKNPVPVFLKKPKKIAIKFKFQHHNNHKSRKLPLKLWRVFQMKCCWKYFSRPVWWICWTSEMFPTESYLKGAYVIARFFTLTFCMVGSFVCSFWKIVSFCVCDNINKGINNMVSITQLVFAQVMRNYFGPFSEASDWLEGEGQEWPCWLNELLHEWLHHLLR